MALTRRVTTCQSAVVLLSLGKWQLRLKADVYAEMSAIVSTFGPRRGVTAIAKIAGGLVPLLT